MQLEPFYDLIKSGQIANAEIAWQIARGMRDSGDNGFTKFVKAVYGWAFSDIPIELPAVFLSRLYNAELRCSVLRKTQIPPESIALSPLVDKINIHNIQTKKFPKGFDVFENLKEFKFGTKTISCLGNELGKLSNLETLKINCQYDFELLPEFIACEQLNRLVVTSKKCVKLPDNLPDMTNLQYMELRCPQIDGPIWSCNQLKSLRIGMLEDEGGKNAKNLFSGVSRLENLESLYISITNISTFQKFLNESICSMKSLKVLDIYLYNSGAYNGNKLTEKITNLSNLEELYIDTVELTEIEFVAKLPKLIKFEIFSLSEDVFNAVVSKMKELGSKAEVMLSDLPF
jgi:Leucine-rich repeat (LRR) protein